jgi:putative lipoic acid-binding regulatory protein
VSAPGESPLKFPTDYPVRVVGRPTEGFRERVHAVIERHAPRTDPARLSERLSANGNFLSISYRLHATSREQIEALVADLQACDGVMMLL